jgi:hypothetical protein
MQCKLKKHSDQQQRVALGASLVGFPNYITELTCWQWCVAMCVCVCVCVCAGGPIERQSTDRSMLRTYLHLLHCRLDGC